MPYIATDHKILTKVLGVNTRMDGENPDELKVRQVVLMEMYEEPEKVDFVYLQGNEVHVKIDTNHYHLGHIRDKYKVLIQANVTEVKSWQITGGYDLPTNSVLIAGEKTPIPNRKKRANYGLNICINFL